MNRSSVFQTTIFASDRGHHPSDQVTGDRFLHVGAGVPGYAGHIPNARGARDPSELSSHRSSDVVPMERVSFLQITSATQIQHACHRARSWHTFHVALSREVAYPSIRQRLMRRGHASHRAIAAIATEHETRGPTRWQRAWLLTRCRTSDSHMQASVGVSVHARRASLRRGAGPSRRWRPALMRSWTKSAGL